MNALKILLTIGITLTGLTLPKMLLAAPTNPNCQSPETQTEMNICAGHDAEAAERRLNQVYKQLKAKISDPQSLKKLINAETAWIKFRDNDCKFAVGLNRGGSIASMMYSGCVENLVVRQRTVG